MDTISVTVKPTAQDHVVWTLDHTTAANIESLLERVAGSWHDTWIPADEDVVLATEILDAFAAAYRRAAPWEFRDDVRRMREAVCR